MYPPGDVDLDRPAVILGHAGTSLTYREYEARVNQLAHVIVEHGLVWQDHLAIFLSNGLEAAVALGAAERTGTYFTMLDAKLGVDEAAWIINDSGARIVVLGRRQVDQCPGLIAACPHVERWLLHDEGDPVEGFESYDHAIADQPITPVEHERLGVSMPYSSGTTGRPKGILRPAPDVLPGTPLPLHAVAEVLYKMRPLNTFLIPGPLHHGMGQFPLGIALRLGGTAVIMERFDAATFLALVDRHAVTHSLMVPTMLSRILALDVGTKASADLSSLEAVGISGAPCPPLVKAAAIEWWGPIVHEIFGTTEANGFTLVESELALRKPGTVGPAVIGELLILDDVGEPCPPGTQGHVWFRGATNFVYNNDADKTADGRDAAGSMSTTGDIGYVDDEGCLFLTDRASFMIVSGGVNIYPLEIENVLIEHPDVVDVSVLGVPDQDRGETVKAVVQLRPGLTGDAATEASIIKACEGRLAKYKWPRSVDFVAAVPRNSTGKLDKKVLRAQYWGEGVGR